MKSLTPHHFVLLTVLPLTTFSTALFIFPAFAMNILSMDVSSAGKMMFQFLGASLAGHAYLNYRARKLDGEMLKQVYIMNIIALAGASVVSVATAIQGELLFTGYLIMIMHLTFLSGFLFYMRRIQ